MILDPPLGIPNRGLGSCGTGLSWCWQVMSSSGRLRIDPQKKRGPKRFQTPCLVIDLFSVTLQCQTPFLGQPILDPKGANSKFDQCPNRLKVPTENARGWAVEFSFFCFIGGLKWYFASSAVERMVQPSSTTNLDPLLRAYALFASSTWFFLHILKWCPIEWSVNLEIRPFLLLFFCPNRLKVPTENARGWAVEFSFFLFHWGSEMVFCIISCWKNGSTSK